jgi:hypothetical protein
MPRPDVRRLRPSPALWCPRCLTYALALRAVRVAPEQGPWLYGESDLGERITEALEHWESHRR